MSVLFEGKSGRSLSEIGDREKKQSINLDAEKEGSIRKIVNEQWPPTVSAGGQYSYPSNDLEYCSARLIFSYYALLSVCLFNRVHIVDCLLLLPFYFKVGQKSV